jgi:hypothetical protein
MQRYIRERLLDAPLSGGIGPKSELSIHKKSLQHAHRLMSDAVDTLKMREWNAHILMTVCLLMIVKTV